MKTTYLSRNNKAKKKTYVTIAVVIALLLMLIFTGLLSKTFFRAMQVLSFSHDQTGQAVSSFSGLFKSRVSLQEENHSLKEQIALLENRLADREILIKENSDLRASLHLKEDTGRIQVRVLSKPPFAPFDIITIGQGESQGIKAGDLVMLGELYLGKVSEVFPDSARVTLLSSPGERIESFVGDDSLPATFTGKGGGNFEASLPQGTPISAGDLVFTTINSQVLYIGNVVSIVGNNANTLMNVLLKIPVNLYELSYVEILPSQ